MAIKKDEKKYDFHLIRVGYLNSSMNNAEKTYSILFFLKKEPYLLYYVDPFLFLLSQ